jgi:hypothetical protein
VAECVIHSSSGPSRGGRHADSSFQDASDSGIVLNSAPLALYRCNVTGNADAGIHAENVAAPDADTARALTARVRAQECIFSGNSADVQLWRGSPIYTDVPAAQLSVGKRSRGRVLPLAQAKGFQGLTSGDHAFVDLRKARCCSRCPCRRRCCSPSCNWIKG